MTMEAFMRQGFLSFEAAMDRQAAELGQVVGVIRQKLGVLPPPPHRPAFVAIGASLAAVAPAVELLNDRGIAARRINAAELENRSGGVGDIADLVIAVSQSGRSRETMGALAHLAVPTIALVNVTDSPIAARAGMAISLGDLPDSLASSIGFSATVIAASMIAETWVDGNPSDNWDSLGERIAEFLPSAAGAIATLADEIDGAVVVDVIAPARLLGSAEATALLLREVPRVPAAPFESRQYLHGLMEAASDHALNILFDGPDSVHMIPRLSATGSPVALFRSEVSSARQDVMIDIALPARSHAETTVFAAAVMQRAVAAVASKRSIRPEDFLFLDTDIKLGDVSVTDNGTDT